MSNYEGYAPFAQEMARLGSVYSVTLTDTETETRIAHMAGILITLNRFLDFMPVDRRTDTAVMYIAYLQNPERYEQYVIDYFSEEAKESLDKLGEVLGKLPEDNRNRFLFDFSLLLDVSLNAQRETKVQRVIQLRKEEGVLSFRTILDMLPTDVITQSGFEAFQKRFERLGIILNIKDTYDDYDDDVDKEKLSLPKDEFLRRQFRSEYLYLMRKDQILAWLTRKTFDPHFAFDEHPQG